MLKADNPSEFFHEIERLRALNLCRVESLSSDGILTGNGRGIYTRVRASIEIPAPQETEESDLERARR